ncbi:MAG: hypothetical protein ACYC10_21305 [Allorhizobium sp.]
MMGAEIESFLGVLGNLDKQLAHSTFNYVSVFAGGRQYLLQGRLFFNAFPPKETFTPFRHGRVRAGQIVFKRLSLTTKEFIGHLLDGCLPIEGNLLFPSSPAFGYKVNYQPLHPAGGRMNRLAVLSVEGADRTVIVQPEVLDWEVRGADRPYDSIQELMSEYRLGFTNPNVSFEAVLPNVAEVDHSSRVIGDKARLGLIMSRDLSKEFASIGYRVIDKQSVVTRSRIHAKDMTWEVTANHLAGVAEITVPRAAIVHCVANFQDVAQYSYYVTDPENAPNDRRSAYESFDPDLTLLREWLFRTVSKGSNARDIEAAISWLAWMLGFSPALLGLFPKTQEAADVIVTTPRGDYAVVECTIGMLRTDNKLPTVVRRANELRERLRSGGSGHLNVLPVIVTSLPRESVAAELEQADRLGVVVVTRETLESAIDQTMLPLHPDDIYTDAVRSRAEAAAKYGAA